MTREEILSIAKPILFNTDMTRAILEERKTATRRKAEFLKGKNPNWTGYVRDGLMLYNGTNEPCIKPPRYKVGDYLYVRETWSTWTDGYVYRAWTEPFPQPGRYADEFMTWRPSIHMPKEAARIFLRVTDVRVERLQDIMKDPPGPNNAILKEGCRYGCDFIAVWESTVPKKERNQYGWDANPWTWVIEFERVIPD